METFLVRAYPSCREKWLLNKCHLSLHFNGYFPGKLGLAGVN